MKTQTIDGEMLIKMFRYGAKILKLIKELSMNLMFFRYLMATPERICR